MKLGFIGLGNMGSAILFGILKNKAINAADIIVCSRNEKGRSTAQAAKVKLAADIKEAAQYADIIILAVKPKDALDAIEQALPCLEGKALLSIVAGLQYAAIYKTLGNVKARVLVALPNTPAMVCAGVTGFTTETTFTETEKTFAVKLFSACGIVEWLSEKLLFALSALSGSGPAFTAIFIESLADAAVLEGLPRSAAYKLAAQTIAGTAALYLETGQHPGIIKDNVCSPAGTTIEGVAALEKHGFRYSVMSAISAASKKFLNK
ncbi:MAG: pyrroline-5-carboxylate reductase [Termitinemataceae bacterium]|nr:MAG: pyrroline-5-carboxylate reductase [Termitinemataceae bacterium]